ncbi:DUF115 domain-containing protein [Pseudoalteromonas tunicata]|uniref:motility associated factor glycosyltransferase family protein n=1 Tax=Pseudoalteromonas tunicata TaxID=314281 RepID=UPI00273DA380|nr:6-hydroxymethylpterin diphosphokinase MptE-like protein [Pseudoalteromonas tunicata]MDP5212464.1 DUF115 domain-containing protein [Pseudoalteromonas tunicata]
MSTEQNSRQNIDELRLELNKRFDKNMVFFQKNMPHIFKQFINYVPKDYGLDFDTNGHLNIACNGQFIFADDPQKICEAQSELFFKRPVQSMYLLVPSEDELNHFNYIHLDYLKKVSDSALKYRHLSNFQNRFRQLPHEPIGKHPFFILIGTGLGYHFKRILEEDIDHLYLYEPSPDLFYASLFTIDWVEVFDHFKYDGKTITLTIGSKITEFIDGLAVLAQKFGQYNLSCLTIYKHYNSETADKALKEYIDNVSTMYSGFGFFEDEILSLNHMHSHINNKQKFLLADRYFDEEHKYPVFICGSGPSLDEAIDTIKKYQDKAIIVSCGTSMLALNRNGIQSDFHIEVERTKGIYDVLDANPFIELKRKPVLIGMNTLYKKVPQQFEDSILYLKPNDGSTDFIRGYYPNNLAVIYSTNPTVTNGAMGIFNQLQSGDIYMFGCDYGYKDKENHHSKSSGYYAEYSDEIKNLVEKTDKLKVKGNFCDEVFTTTIFSWARRSIEYSIRSNILASENKKVFNCSDGAMIDGTIPLRMEEIKLETVVDKELIRQLLLTSTTDEFFEPKEWVKKLTQASEHLFSTIDRIVDEKYRLTDLSSKDVSLLFNRMFKIIRECDGTQEIFTARMLEGSFTYIASTILGHMYAIGNEKSRQQYLKEVLPLMYQYFIDLKSELKNKVLNFEL